MGGGVTRTGGLVAGARNSGHPRVGHQAPGEDFDGIERRHVDQDALQGGVVGGVVEDVGAGVAAVARTRNTTPPRAMRGMGEGSRLDVANQGNALAAFLPLCLIGTRSSFI